MKPGTEMNWRELNDKNINDSVKLLERNIRKMSETYLDCTAETVAAREAGM